MSANTIWEMWQQHKMTAAHAMQELLHSRTVTATSMIGRLKEHMAAEEEQRALAMLHHERQLLDTSFQRFRLHPAISVFLAQFNAVQPQSRYKSLLLRGPSRCGKTQKALSLFGADSTLSVNCQGVAPHLPSIRAFVRKQHAAILWDEIVESQVLSNKLCFQSGLTPVTLGQSACNQHAYQVILYKIPMILCSNTFRMGDEEGSDLAEEDRDWLSENIVVAELGPGEKWFLDK